MLTKGDVLIVEDEEIYLQPYMKWLTEAGFTVKGARGGAEALKILDSFVPDVILLDVHLPDTDGRRLCSKIRERPGYNVQSAKYIVMMSNIFTSGMDVEKGLDKGADFYQTRKPDAVDGGDELVSIVRALMRKMDGGNKDKLWEDKEWFGVDHRFAIGRHHPEIRIGQNVKNIPPAQYDILCHLYKNFDKPCSEKALCDVAHIVKGTLPKEISTLRSTIKELLELCQLGLSEWAYLPRKSERGYTLRKPVTQSS